MPPLQPEPSGPARLLQARVDGRVRVCVRQNYYSVAARYAGRRLPVRLSATAVEVPGGSRWWPSSSCPPSRGTVRRSSGIAGEQVASRHP